MKKRILAMALALTMVFTLVSVSAAEPTSVRDAIFKYGEDRGITGAALTNWLTRSIEVPLDIQVKETGAGDWLEAVNVRGRDVKSLPTVDFMATLDMSVVEAEFENLVGAAKTAINTVGGSNAETLINNLENISVTGTFKVTISIPPDNITFPNSYKANNKDMNGFDVGAKEIFEETERTFTANEAEIKIEIKIKVKDGQTKATLADKIGRPITFAVNEVAVKDFGTPYTLKGMLEGSTVIGDNIATVEYATMPLGIVGDVNHNPDAADAPWAAATVIAERSTPPDGGGGGGSVSAVKVDFIVDGKVYKTVTGKSPATIDISEIVPTEKEGYEFVGWYLDKELTKPATSPITVSTDTKLYAKYKVATGPVLNKDDHFAYIIGYTDGTVRPLNNILREEVATIFFRLLTEEAGEAMHKEVAPYSDVPERRWSSTAIATLSSGGYITGRPDGTFGPSEFITRAEFATIAARFIETLDENGVELSDIDGHWAKNYIEACASAGLITGYTDGTFKPDQYITRAEVMAIVNRMLGRAVDTEGIKAVEDDIYMFRDNQVGTWCYYIVLEATNSHDFTRAEGAEYETWTKVTEVRDWAAYEK